MKMSTRVGWLCCGLGLALGANQARAQADPPKAQPAPKAKAEAPKANAAGADATFVREAATAGMAEVELGRLGVQKATRAEVIAQVRMSSDAIYEAVGRRPITLAYPGGAYNTAVMDAVRSEGSTWMAFSVEFGCSESWSTRLHEQRMIMRHDFTPANVLAKVAPYAAG